MLIDVCPVTVCVTAALQKPLTADTVVVPDSDAVLKGIV